MLDRLGRREAAEEGELGATTLGRRAQENRAQEGRSRRGLPGSPEAASARGLHVADGHSALGKRPGEEPLGRLAGVLVEVRSPESPRQKRLDAIGCQEIHGPH